jgi:lysophospholipase L1-like esterase
VTSTPASRPRQLHAFYERIARCQADYRERPILVCFFGDSNTAGWGNESIQHREAYPTRVIAALHDLHPRCPFNGLNSGVAGDTLTQAMDRIDRDVLRYEPDLTVIAFALNDAMGGAAALPAYRDSLSRAIDRIRPRSAIVLLTPCMMATRPTPIVPVQWQDAIGEFVRVQTSGTLDIFVDAMRQAAREHDVLLADAYRTWQELAAAGVDTTSLLANGINHPFGAGHRFFAEAILRCLE